MTSSTRNALLAQTLDYWNWKCALMSATARSLVCFAAMVHGGLRGSIAAVVVELAYVSITSGAYAGMQQKALSLRNRALGNLMIAAGVPALAQTLDWYIHQLWRAPVTGKALLSMSAFAAISALFHLHIMRNGVFLSGRGHSLVGDFRQIPRLLAGFVTKPLILLTRMDSQMSVEVKNG